MAKAVYSLYELKHFLTLAVFLLKGIVKRDLGCLLMVSLNSYEVQSISGSHLFLIESLFSL
jgi:hypothetical protein